MEGSEERRGKGEKGKGKEKVREACPQFYDEVHAYVHL